ncbi:unnamed protein product [Amoebophrya sp. A120]|nr:unnamed protein product [Amoebophrya sp. A120]|eukprot:GSA120T00022050001.1
MSSSAVNRSTLSTSILHNESLSDVLGTLRSELDKLKERCRVEKKRINTTFGGGSAAAENVVGSSSSTRGSFLTEERRRERNEEHHQDGGRPRESSDEYFGGLLAGPSDSGHRGGAVASSRGTREQVDLFDRNYEEMKVAAAARRAGPTSGAHQSSYREDLDREQYVGAQDARAGEQPWAQPFSAHNPEENDYPQYRSSSSSAFLFENDRPVPVLRKPVAVTPTAYAKMNSYDSVRKEALAFQAARKNLNTKFDDYQTERERRNEIVARSPFPKLMTSLMEDDVDVGPAPLEEEKYDSNGRNKTSGLRDGFLDDNDLDLVQELQTAIPESDNFDLQTRMLKSSGTQIGDSLLGMDRWPSSSRTANGPVAPLFSREQRPVSSRHGSNPRSGSRGDHGPLSNQLPIREGRFPSSDATSIRVGNKSTKVPPVWITDRPPVRAASGGAGVRGNKNRSSSTGVSGRYRTSGALNQQKWSVNGRVAPQGTSNHRTTTHHAGVGAPQARPGAATAASTMRPRSLSFASSAPGGGCGQHLLQAGGAKRSAAMPIVPARPPASASSTASAGGGAQINGGAAAANGASRAAAASHAKTQQRGARQELHPTSAAGTTNTGRNKVPNKSLENYPPSALTFHQKRSTSLGTDTMNSASEREQIFKQELQQEMQDDEDSLLAAKMLNTQESKAEFVEKLVHDEIGHLWSAIAELKAENGVLKKAISNTPVASRRSNANNFLRSSTAGHLQSAGAVHGTTGKMKFTPAARGGSSGTTHPVWTSNTIGVGGGPRRATTPSSVLTWR